MTRSDSNDSNQSVYRALAEFRHQLRTFLVSSEQAAQEAGLHPQQHQLLLALAGAPSGAIRSIAYAAERLRLKHNTVVELVDRCESEGLLRRAHDPGDGRRVCLEITAGGHEVLDRLSRFHLQELHSAGPFLIASLHKVLESMTDAVKPSRNRSRG